MRFFTKNKIALIAEVANAHGGNLKVAKKITEAASKSGANIIKFQIFKTNELLESHHEKFSHFKQLELHSNEWLKLIQFAKKKNLIGSSMLKRSIKTLYGKILSSQ